MNKKINENFKPQISEIEAKLNNLDIQNVAASTFKPGDKVKVLIGCVWQNAEVERLHPSGDGYNCGTSKWSTYFPFCNIRHI